MTALIKRLSQVVDDETGIVGGKASGLAALIASGARVPDGIVVATPNGELTPDDHTAILGAIDVLGADRFAVRSSGVAEDGLNRSYAGMFDSLLDVPRDEVVGAVDRVVDSARHARVTDYDGGSPTSMAVIVEAMVPAVAAGVALTADPISGDRSICIVTATRGIGDRLVSGETTGDEWVVTRGTATPRRVPQKAIGPHQAILIANEANRIARIRGIPQDVEWAIDGEGTLWIVQARPMTALPPVVSWEPPVAGIYSRQLRFGEWIAGPVTPLFESWLLTAMEERLHEQIRIIIGQKAPRPYHVVVNGWYFYSLNWMLPGAWLRTLPRLLWHLARAPRQVAGILPPTVRFSIALSEREWREDVRPRYRTAVADAEASIETARLEDLIAIVDGLADLAGEYFTSIAAFGGAAYKMEMNLAGFYRRHLAPTLGGSHLPLLAGFATPDAPARHAVVSLDWWEEPGSPAIAAPPRDHARIVAAREAAEDEAFAVLGASPRRLRAFNTLLREAQRLVPIREELTAELTLAWPVMRRAVARLGDELVRRGRLDDPDDVFFLTRQELLDELGDDAPALDIDVAPRKAAHRVQAGLVPPAFVGPQPWALRRMLPLFTRMVGGVPADEAVVSGAPASPGRATGPARVVRGPDAFDQLQPGEILVAPVTAPAWTPLFARASAVVTDVGSAASHASIIAREYGIPAVVGCGDATARLHDGMRLTVDGSTGNVFAAVDAD